MEAIVDAMEEVMLDGYCCTTMLFLQTIALIDIVVEDLDWLVVSIAMGVDEDDIRVFLVVDIA